MSAHAVKSGLRSGIGCLLAGFLLLVAMAEPVQAASIRDQITSWITRLEKEITVLQAQAATQEGAATITRVGPGANLKLNASGERVGRLSQRLVEMGYLQNGLQSTVFDANIDTAVRALQSDLSLKPDGLIGSQTLAALDRTPAETIAIIRRTIEEMRRFIPEAPETVVLVNLPNQTVTLVRRGQVEFSMRAVVGRPSRETPLLKDAITHIIVNPTWTVPPTVLKDDKLPLLRKNGAPGIELADVYLDGDLVAPETVDWSNVTPNRVRIVQTPGNHNALGRFRFNLTNDKNIYLHGTNDPKVFDRDTRTVSSGCVRLQDARRMAEMLLGESPATTTRIDNLLATSQPQWIKLAKPVPVRFMYWMATVTPEDTVRIHLDIYGLGDNTGASAGRAV